MDREQLAAYIEKALDGLKDFQRASVDALYSQLYGHGRPSMLLADEVGLGKTVVAKGLIARILKQRMAEGRRTPFRVTYICSNQVIARENLRKLDLFPDGKASQGTVSRLAYLALASSESAGGDGSGKLLALNTLTPATSLQLATGAGNRSERLIAYAALCHDLKMRNRRKGLQWVLQGTVQLKSMNAYREQMERARDWGLRADLPRNLIDLLKKEIVPENVNVVYDELGTRQVLSIYEATLVFAKVIDGRNARRLWRTSYYLAKRIREALVKSCINYVGADLYILDEFQRFSDLIDEDCGSDEAILARTIFRQKRDTRLLLLSATPFKAFTGPEDIERGEDHYRDFRRVLRFLLHSDEALLARYETHRQALYRQIVDLRREDLNDLPSRHRDEVQQVLRTVMCRTERQSVASDPGAMLLDTWKEPSSAIPFGDDDIRNFLGTDRLVRALARAGYDSGKPVEYCKSAPFPLSFLDRYKLKEELKKRRSIPAILTALRQSRDSWLDLEAIDGYRWRPAPDPAEPTSRGSGNARFAQLVDQAIGPYGAELLWIPPSLPYYGLEGAFAEATGFTKTLLFSAWVMVPRMVATLLSYEIERRTVGNAATIDRQHESAPRTYFTEDSTRRHPIPQLRYARRLRGSRGKLANMSNFTLLYPSPTLASVVAPVENLTKSLSLQVMKEKARQEIQAKLDRLNLEGLVNPGGEGERWYWAAPLLMDRDDDEARDAVNAWFEAPLVTRDHEGAEGEEGMAAEEDERGAKKEHRDFLAVCFENPVAIGLGRPPADLAEVLADLAIGAPALVALRSLRRHFPEQSEISHVRRAAEIADEFITLFNKPESIAAIRLSERRLRRSRPWYWRKVAEYCASGCLQAVIDEYFHLLRGQNVTFDGAVDQLIGATNLKASSINVDSLDTFLTGHSRKMRCHYAVEFGSQRIETDQGRKRASGMREVFNSPFRPFVLATTSIGQEGLDFHSYCRRIVHWNLPGNPVDLEQREGRINRFKSLVIRQQIARRYGPDLALTHLSHNDDIWELLFRIADREEREKAGKSELIPFWHVETPGELRIERVIPIYPFSADQGKLRRILRTLAIYRLAFGQPRQAELVDHLLERNFSPEELKEVMDKLVIDLSPMGA
jgi:hypothetical protein